MPKGNATEWAYKVKLFNGRISMDRVLTATGTDTPADAVKIVGSGETATILASRMSEFNTLWEGRSIESEELGLPTKAELKVMVENLEIG